MAAPSRADDDAHAEARRLFETGNEQLDRGAYVEALASFEQAYARWQNPKILLNIATTLRQLGRLAQGADRYEQYINDPGADRAKREQAQATLQEIDASIGHLKVSVDRSDVELRVDGSLVDSSSRGHLRLDPGPHTIIVSGPGLRPLVKDVVVAAGERKELAFAPEPEPPAPTAPTAPDAKPARQPEDASRDAAAGAEREDLRLGAVLRADIDGKMRGAVAAIGVSLGVAPWADGQVTALLGRDKGVEPAITVYLMQGTIRPLLFAGVPVFLVDGARPGAHAAAGVQLDPWDHVGLLAQLGVAAFATAPESYDHVMFLPSIGAQGRF